MLSSTASAAVAALARELPTLVVCPVCGETESGDHMEAVEIEVCAPIEVDASGIPGARRAFMHTMRLEWRCRRCRAPLAECVH